MRNEAGAAATERTFFLWNFNGISNQPATQDSAWQKGASVRLGRTPREDFPSASRRLAQISLKNVARKTRTAFARVAIVGGSSCGLRHVRHFPFQLSQFSSLWHRMKSSR